MKRPLKNIISIILLVFYLAGFCGIHLVKHSCTACEHSSLQMSYEDDSESQDNQCCCHQHQCEKKSDTCNDVMQESLCCDFELISLKTNPTTTIIESRKAPMASELDLLIYNSLNLHPFVLSVPKKQEYHNISFIPPSIAAQEDLCCFLC